MTSKYEKPKYEKVCFFCNKNGCYTSCLNCKDIVCCKEKGNHSLKCGVCQDLLCSSFIPGKIIIWYSKKTNSVRAVCSDCLFDGALYVRGLMNFNSRNE